MTANSKDSEPIWPFPDPRVAGVRIHYQRVKFFHELADGCTDTANTFRLLLAGLYSARAVVELILEASDKEQIEEKREDVKVRLSSHIPWYNLIEKIRIHDFHRIGIVPPNPQVKSTMLIGPLQLRARKGSAVYQVRPCGPKKTITGNAEINEQRPLLYSDGRFFDDNTQKYVSLDEILRDFVDGAAETIAEFQRNLQRTQDSSR